MNRTLQCLMMVLLFAGGAWAASIQAVLDSADGSSAFQVLDQQTNEVFRVNSLGQARMTGTLDMNRQMVTGAVFYGDGQGLTNIPASGVAEADPVWNAQKAGYATGTPLYAYSETDPVWTATSNVVMSQLAVLQTNVEARLASNVWAAAASTTNYVARTGDTMTGTLAVQTNLVIQYNADRGNGEESLLTIGGGNDVEIGAGANGYFEGVAVGPRANGYNRGTTMGRDATSVDSGVAIGFEANGADAGAAVGYQANGDMYGAAVGFRAKAPTRSVALGSYANSLATNVAIGFFANAAEGLERIAIGHNVTNSINHSTRVRGTLYLDGGTGVYVRTTFGSGAWRDLLAAYARTTDVAAAYVSKAGDTMTGTLMVQTNLVVQYNADRGSGARSMLTIGGGAGVEIGMDADGYDDGVGIGQYANARDKGVAVGIGAFATNYSVAVGWQANASHYAVAVGPASVGQNYGAGVGSEANGESHGAALGQQANGSAQGAAIGSAAKGNNSGVAVGHLANGVNYGVALGREAAGSGSNVAVGIFANAQGGPNRTAVGPFVTNAVDDSIRVRGALYLDGGTSVYVRSTFGDGAWSDLLASRVKKSGDTMTGPLVVVTNITLSYTTDRGAGNRQMTTIFGGQDVEIGVGANGYNGGVGIGEYAWAQDFGVAVGSGAEGTNSGTAVGHAANGSEYGTAVGDGAVAQNQGVGVGYASRGRDSGAAVGYQANAMEYGAAMGRSANGRDYGAAVGYNARGLNYGVALGYETLATNQGVAVGALAVGHSQGVAVGVNANGVGGVAVGLGADGVLNGTAVGAGADATNHGVAVGFNANGLNYGVAVGTAAEADGYGAALGQLANGALEGAAVGAGAKGNESGVAIGRDANGMGMGVAAGRDAVAHEQGAAVGHGANAVEYGAALGYEANAYDRAVALGYQANAAGGTFRTAIGYGTVNDVDESTRIRGTLYIDGTGTADANIKYRQTFGSGGWSTKTFLIDHPLDPENKVLRHYCMEGPEVLNVYAGTATLDEQGQACVVLPDYFEALNTHPQYVLTAVGAPMPNLHVAIKIADGAFTIGGGAPGGEVSWEVKARRNDPACLEDLKQRPVEQLKRELAPGQAAAENQATDTQVPR